MHPKAETIIRDFRGGSSLPVLVETSSGSKCIIKWKGTGEGPLANAVDWTALWLARHAGLPVPTPHLVTITADLVDEERDPDINDLILRSLGINLGVEFIEGATPFDRRLAETTDVPIRERIYAFDALFLNIDRTDLNPNMVFSGNEMYCIDFASTMAIKMLLNGGAYSENLFLPLIRRHPFYCKKEDIEIVQPIIDAEALEEIVESMPDEWLAETDRTKQDLLTGLTTIFEDARAILERRLSLLDETPLESAEARKARLLANRKAFESKWPL
ncbi:MAG TPA: hypothetical protein DCP63_06010 [Bacteroidetes bacterium]|nr:hypothetical protein [Bacteroidota bacterium]